jgi:hypothetical protein
LGIAPEVFSMSPRIALKQSLGHSGLARQGQDKTSYSSHSSLSSIVKFVFVSKKIPAKQHELLLHQVPHVVLANL